MEQLRRVAIVMVGTTHPGNIGAAARAMGNMGLERLVLVRPQANVRDPIAVARAAGFGRILDHACEYPDLATALAPNHRAYAFTARRRGLAQRVINARSACLAMNTELAASRHIALVFGPEHSGLTNIETDLCDCLVHIPTQVENSSLNIAAAIQIACYELSMATNTVSTAAAKDNLATKREIHDLLEHVEQVLVDCCPARHPGLQAKMMRRLNQLVNRASPDQADVRMLRGLLSAIAKLKD